jgi:branched-subunit amino acid ABC-type transport system permease component
MFVAFHIFLIYTQTGRKIRASAQDKIAAQLMGINVSRIYSLVYALGTGFDGIAGTLIAITTPFSCIDVGYYILTAFFVVVLGGAGSLLGALTGGIILGLVQSFTGTFLGIRFMNLVMFLFLVIILIIKPEGLFGK